jgi:hypothetical protein
MALVTQRYALAPQGALAAGEQLLELRRGDDVVSRLRTRPAPVLWASSPHDSFTVELELQDPATAPALPGEALPIPAAPAQTAAPPSAAAPVATNPSSGASAATPQAAKEAETETPKTSAWQSLFPRRRVPKDQLQNLDRGNVYQ